MVISELTQYGAIYGKVKALYGNRLLSEDFRRMGSMHSVPEIAAFLKSKPGWADCLSGVRIADISRGVLENALHEQYLGEFLKLYKHAAMSDKRLMNFPMLHMEMDQVLTALRSLHSLHMGELVLPLSQEIKNYSKIDFSRLASVTSYPMLLDAIKNTVFYRPLTIATGKSADKLPDYMQAERVVQTAYYREMYGASGSNHVRNVQTAMNKYLGEEIDMLNILRVIRLKINFPSFTNDIFTSLLPFNYKLGNGVVRRLFSCPDLKTMLEVLRTTYYKKVFGDYGFNKIEDYHNRAIYIKNRKMLTEGYPSILMAIAYLNLKRIELSNITHVVEAVRYGIDPAKAGAYFLMDTHYG